MATAQQMLDELLTSMENPVDKEVQNVTGILYGESGGGKTVLALQLAQAIRGLYGGEILHIDAVNAWRSVKNHPELQDGLIRLKYKGKAQLDVITQALEAKVARFENVKVVILDEASAMQDMDGETVLLARCAADPSKDPDVLTQPDMGAVTVRMSRSILRLLRNDDISVIMVSHQRDDEDKNVGYKVIRPRFMPKLSGTLREGLDFVAYMSATPMTSGGQHRYERTVQAHPSRNIVAKTRVGGLEFKVTPEVFVSQVIKWLKGEVGNSTRNVVIDDRLVDTSEVGSEDFSDSVID